MRRSLLTALVAVAALIISGFVLAQSSFSHIHGIVRDGNGRPLAGVQVVLSTSSSFHRETLTGEASRA